MIDEPKIACFYKKAEAAESTARYRTPFDHNVNWYKPDVKGGIPFDPQGVALSGMYGNYNPNTINVLRKYDRNARGYTDPIPVTELNASYYMNGDTELANRVAASVDRARIGADVFRPVGSSKVVMVNGEPTARKSGYGVLDGMTSSDIDAVRAGFFSSPANLVGAGSRVYDRPEGYEGIKPGHWIGEIDAPGVIFAPNPKYTYEYQSNRGNSLPSTGEWASYNGYQGVPINKIDDHGAGPHETSHAYTDSWIHGVDTEDGTVITDDISANAKLFSILARAKYASPRLSPPKYSSASTFMREMNNFSEELGLPVAGSEVSYNNYNTDSAYPDQSDSMGRAAEATGADQSLMSRVPYLYERVHGRGSWDSKDPAKVSEGVRYGMLEADSLVNDSSRRAFEGETGLKYDSNSDLAANQQRIPNLTAGRDINSKINTMSGFMNTPYNAADAIDYTMRNSVRGMLPYGLNNVVKPRQPKPGEKTYAQFYAANGPDVANGRIGGTLGKAYNV